MAYLYDYIVKLWKTYEFVHTILDSLYHGLPDGLPGNEDCGQMSAWYVLSAMGFYEVTPGDPVYAIGTPIFQDVKIHLDNRHTFEIIADSVSDSKFYIQSA